MIGQLELSNEGHIVNNMPEGPDDNPWTSYAHKLLSELDDPALTCIGKAQNDFVLRADRESCDFDNLYTRPLDLQWCLPPVPYVGDPRRARVIVLAANPGFVTDTREYDCCNRHFITQSLKSLTFHSACPIHYLDDAFAAKEGHPKTKAYPGYRWWDGVFAHVISDALSRCGDEFDRNDIISNLAGIEWLPYHSNSFDMSNRNRKTKRMFGNELPSQRYARSLVKAAIGRNAQLVLIWGRPHRAMWEESLGDSLPKSTIFAIPEKVRPKRICSSYYAKDDVEKIVRTLVARKME